VGPVAHIGRVRNACKILVGNHEGKRPVGRPRRSWKNSVKMEVKEIGWEVMDCIHLAHVRISGGLL